MKNAPKNPMINRKGLINGVPYKKARKIKERDPVKEETKGLLTAGIIGFFMIIISVFLLTDLYKIFLP